MSVLFYHLDRLLLAGAPLARWISGLLLFIGVLAGFGLFPGRWWTASLCAVLLIGFTLSRRHWRKREYLTFAEQERPAIEPEALAPSDSVPISASGYFSVEGKNNRFTWLEGYFRTFATREHAVICLVQPRRVLLAEWPENELGMWYVFFYPKTVRSIRYGTITFGRVTQPGLAIEREVHIPKKGRFSRERTVNETVYLASPTEADTRRILADLLFDRQPRAKAETAEKSAPPPGPARNGHVKTPISATRRLH